MIFKTAWKNVWRNRVRSTVVIASVTIGVSAAIFSIAFMNGMIAQRVDAAIDEEISHIQITGNNFRLNNDPQILVNNFEDVKRVVSNVGGIAGVVDRTVISGMAATASKSTGIQIIGIDPEREKEIFKLYSKIMEGTGDYFQTASKNEPAVIGHDLARELNIVRYIIDSSVIRKLTNLKVPEEVRQKLNPLLNYRFPNEKKFNKTISSLLTPREVKEFGQLIKKEAWSFREGSRLTLTFLDRDNNQVGARFRIAGVYDLKNSMFQQNIVFVRDSDIREYIGIDSGSCHQLVIRIKDIKQTEMITAELKEKLPELEIMNWKEIQPDLAMMTDYVYQMYGIFMAIILAALAFGIVNTMLMAVLERTRELGMLTAIGMNRKKVFSMIMLESVFLSLTGGISGMAIGWITVLLTAKNGINFVKYAEGMEAYGYSAHVYPEIGLGFYFMGAILIIITGILSSVYPALRALKLNPVEAIRKE